MSSDALQEVAGCIVRDDKGRYLMVQERLEKVYGKWNIPAGWVEDGETPAEAAVRETKEEVGFDVVLEEKPAFQAENVQKARRYYAFTAHVAGGELTVQDTELLDARWLTFAQVTALHETGQVRDEWIMGALTEVEHAYPRD